MKCLEAVPADKKPFKCSQCEFTFASMSDPDEHGKVHTYKKLIECSLCCQMFVPEELSWQHTQSCINKLINLG